MEKQLFGNKVFVMRVEPLAGFGEWTAIPRDELILWIERGLVMLRWVDVEEWGTPTLEDEQLTNRN